MNKIDIINEIKGFLEGYNEDLKYLVHVEANPNNNYAECIVHPPDGEKQIMKVDYTPFSYVKDFKKHNITLYNGDTELQKEKMIQYGIKFKKLETGNQKRLEEGYCYMVTSHKSYNAIINFFRDGGIYPFEKATDAVGNLVKDKKGDPIYLYRHLFFAPKPYEQFLINKKARLFKGYEEYKDIHRVIFDIETTGLRPEISRVFSIGVRDNKGFETVLEVSKTDDDEAEINLIVDFLNLLVLLKPAVIAGYNSEDFDFYYLLGRAKILKIDVEKLITTLKPDIKLKRKPNSTVKIGDKTERYTATEMWGISVIDILHAAKKTAVVNSDLQKTNLKYVAKFEKIARENRTYIPGEDNSIGRYYHENPFFIANDDNVHIEIPQKFTKTVENLFKAQENKSNLTAEQYGKVKKYCLDQDPEFVVWFRKEAAPQKMHKFIRGRKLVRQYLLDDLWETEQVDELYNQSSFMLAKIVPTTYTRICTMGTASVWNLLLTAWSYEKGLAIPHPDSYGKMSGGLARCYKRGYTKRLVKIDYASLYPMLQLTWDIFPIFDISGVMKMMLIYMTTTRNIYKKLAKGTPLNEEEVELMKGMDHEGYTKYLNNLLVQKDKDMYDVKQKPIKTLNNSQFGALASNIAFNWSDNDCAARITCCGRLELRHAIKWFERFECIPLYAVTDGVNFHIPDKTTIMLTKDGTILHNQPEGIVEDMWKYGTDEKGDDIVGINALIEYFNDHEMQKPFMAVDNDGEFVSCFNVARINYAVLQEKKDKKTNEIKKKIKLTGNSLKSTVLPEYIEEFMENGWKLILDGKGKEFVDYYYEYTQDIFYKQIPLKNIASKSKYKNTLKQYANRGTDKNGRLKAKQAHMELVILEREKMAEELFQKHKDNLEFSKKEEELTIEEKKKLIEVYMPPEPELDSTLYYYNNGYRKSHGDSKKIKDKDTGELRFASTLINKNDLIENEDMKGDYNIDKYLTAFNERICYSQKKIGGMLSAFDPEIAEKIPVKIVRKKEKDESGNKVETEELVINHFTSDQLVLKSFDLDDVDDSMYLEENEVKFWNKTGFDPRLVWNGFKMHDDMAVHFEIYENALKFLNDKMEKAGKPLIKSRNEQISKGEYVLIKSGGEYSVGYHNGKYIEIVRSNIDVPKSEYELEMEQKNKENEEQIQKLDNVDFKTQEEGKLLNQLDKRKKYFSAYKKQFKIDANLEMDKFMELTNGEGGDLIDGFIIEEEKKINDEALNYGGID